MGGSEGGSMREGVEEGVDSERVAFRPERHEVARVVALALPRVADVGVVRDQDNDAALLIRNRAEVRDRAVGSLFGCSAARPHVETDVRDLRHVSYLELRAEN